MGIKHNCGHEGYVKQMDCTELTSGMAYTKLPNGLIDPAESPGVEVVIKTVVQFPSTVK